MSLNVSLNHAGAIKDDIALMSYVLLFSVSANPASCKIAIKDPTREKGGGPGGGGGRIFRGV
jgi:hypothetical protein